MAAHGLSTELLRSHLNDVICVPFFVPMMLWANKRLGLRRHDGPPDAVEIVVPLIIWSALFEIVIPLQRDWHVPTIADPKDVLSYCLGAMVAAAFWKMALPQSRDAVVASDRGEPPVCPMTTALAFVAAGPSLPTPLQPRHGFRY